MRLQFTVESHEVGAKPCRAVLVRKGQAPIGCSRNDFVSETSIGIDRRWFMYEAQST